MVGLRVLGTLIGGLAVAASLGANVYFLFVNRPAELAVPRVPLPLGYQAFDVPRSFGGQPLVGAIVSIGPKSGFRYTSHLSRCGIDVGVLVPQEGIVALPVISRKASAAGKFSAEAGAAVNAEGQASNEVTISLLRPKELFVITGDVLFDAIKNSTRFKSACGNFFDDKNAFWIPQAIVSDEFEISYSGAGGAKAGLDAKSLKLLQDFAVNLGIKGEGELTQTSSLKYKGERLYIGFRSALPVELLTGRVNSFAGNEDATSLQLGDLVYSGGRW